jgi:hypothetical protein
LFKFREVGKQVSLVAMSCLSQRTIAPPPCLPLDIKDWLKEDVEFFDRRLIGGLLAMMMLVGCWVMLETWNSASLITDFKKAKERK